MERMNTLRYYRFPERKVWKIGFILYLYLLLILTRDTTYSAVLWGFNKTQAVTIVLILLLGVVFLLWNRKNLKQILLDGRIAVIAVSTVVMLTPMLVKQDWQLMYLTMLLPIYVAVFFSFFTTSRDVAKNYVYIMIFLAATSLAANYAVKPIVEELNPAYPYLNERDFHFFHNFYISFPHIWAGYYRNYGIFSEPGLYQFFLILALYLNHYIITWDKPWKLWSVSALLAVTIVSTFSTAGVIELALFAVILFFDMGFHKNRKIRRLTIGALLLGAVAIAIILYCNYWLYVEVYEMVEKLFVATRSSSNRINAVITNLNIFIRNPVFGEKVANVLMIIDDNVITSLIMYAILGVFGGSLNVAAWAALVWNKEKSIWVNLGLLAVLLMSFNTQNLATNLFFGLIPYMALTERCLPLLQGKAKKK